jgi:hypothetical protein
MGKSMSFLIPVQYHKRKYPFGLSPKIKEVAANFDVEQVDASFPCSVHTEYSWGPRKLTSPIINKFKTIQKAHRNGVPQLWFNKKWAEEFVDFIATITKRSKSIKIIEIHPPFNDYCPTIDHFIEIYKTFEERILSVFPGVEILIENRFGSLYKGGKFLVANNTDIISLSEAIEKNNSSLRIVLDVPQLFTSHIKSMKIAEKNIKPILEPLSASTSYIKGIHIWGKKRSEKGRWVAHQGNLNTYFDNNAILKKRFMAELRKLFEDDMERYFVPEVNSSDDDLESIVMDFKKEGFQFI